MASRGAPRAGTLGRGFFVVGVSVDATGSPAPKLLLRRSFGGDSSDDHLITVSFEKHFCFPEYVKGDLTSLVPETHLKPNMYAFVLTESDGVRTTGHCRRFLPPGTGPRFPIVTCVLSRMPWLRFFEQALEPIDAQVCLCASPCLRDVSCQKPESVTPVLSTDTHLFAYVSALCAVGTPRPNAEVRLPINWAHPPDSRNLPRSVSFFAPDDGASTSKTHASASVGMKFKHILRGAFTDCAPAVALFAALLFERRVVISGSDTGAVAGAVHAAAASIAPFKWHHIFLPILPHQFLEYLTAPMPFLVGVHASCLPFIKKLPTEEVFHLNLDSGEYTYFESDLDALPGRPRRALELKLQQQLEQPRLDDERVCHAFRVFLSTCVANYRKHVVPETSERRVPSNAICANGYGLGPFPNQAAHCFTSNTGDCSDRLRHCCPYIVQYTPNKWTDTFLYNHRLWLDCDSFFANAGTRRTKVFLAGLKSTRLFEVFMLSMLQKIGNDPKQTGMLGARLGQSTAGDAVFGLGLAGSASGSGSASSSSSVFASANSSVTAETALLAHAARDFEHELSNDAAFTAIYRAGSTAAGASAAVAAAATTRAALGASSAAVWGAKTGAKMFDKFVVSAYKKTERALAGTTSFSTSASYSTATGTNHRGAYDTFGVHDDDSPVGNPVRSSAFVGVGRFRNGGNGHETTFETGRGVDETGIHTEVRASSSAVSSASPSGPNFSPSAVSPSAVSRISVGSIAEAAAAATARRAASPTGATMSPTGATMSPTGMTMSSTGTTVSPTGATMSPTGAASPHTTNALSPTESGSLRFVQPQADPFALAVSRNKPPVLQPVPTNRRTPSRTDWVDFDADDAAPFASPASPPPASPASPTPALSTTQLVDPFASLTVSTAAHVAQQKRDRLSSVSPTTNPPTSPPADPGDALAAVLGLGSPSAQPHQNLIDF